MGLVETIFDIEPSFCELYCVLDRCLFRLLRTSIAYDRFVDRHHPRTTTDLHNRHCIHSPSPLFDVASSHTLRALSNHVLLHCVALDHTLAGEQSLRLALRHPRGQNSAFARGGEVFSEFCGS